MCSFFFIFLELEGNNCMPVLVILFEKLQSVELQQFTATMQKRKHQKHCSKVIQSKNCLSLVHFQPEQNRSPCLGPVKYRLLIKLYVIYHTCIP